MDQSVAGSLEDVEGENGDAALKEATIVGASLCKFCRLLRKNSKDQVCLESPE